MNTLYTCYETSQTMNKTDWQSYYNKYIDKLEYSDFTSWFYDMRKLGVLEIA